MCSLSFETLYVGIEWILRSLRVENQTIDRYAWHCVRQGCQICSKCNNFSCTFVWFATRSDLNIHSISTCNVSNERKQISDQIYNLLFLSRGYAPGVMINFIY